MPPKSSCFDSVHEIASHKPPAAIYFLTLYHLFSDLGEQLDEERIVKSATGIRDTVVWKKAVQVSARRRHRCHRQAGAASAAASSPTASASEKRSRRSPSSNTTSCATTACWCSCPKRLRDNWTLYKANDRRNILAADRFNYDVLNHTDLSRDGGMSGDIDLSHVNWGNYDLVVIDESHNFRNKTTPTRSARPATTA